MIHTKKYSFNSHLYSSVLTDKEIRPDFHFQIEFVIEGLGPPTIEQLQPIRNSKLNIPCENQKSGHHVFLASYSIAEDGRTG